MTEVEIIEWMRKQVQEKGCSFVMGVQGSPTAIVGNLSTAGKSYRLDIDEPAPATVTDLLSLLIAKVENDGG